MKQNTQADSFSADVPIVIEFPQAQILPKYGIGHPRTEDQLRWLHRRRSENGLADCFVQIAGRWLFKPRRYIELVNGQKPAA